MKYKPSKAKQWAKLENFEIGLINFRSEHDIRFNVGRSELWRPIQLKINRNSR
jgi:hypothetical protein